MEPPKDLEEALKRFAEVWKNLPPLVRSSLCVSVMEYCAKHANTDQGGAARLMGAGLGRRAAVLMNFVMASDTMGALMVDLCRLSDAEAEATGVYADIGSTQFYQVGSKDEEPK